MNILPSDNKQDKLWKFSEKLTQICILGALWILCSLPIVTIGASTTAMYAVFMHNSTNGRPELAKPFFASFKANFKSATIIWLIGCPIITILAVDIFYYLYLSHNTIFHQVMGITMLCLLTIVMMVYCYVFPMMAMYKNTIKETLIKSIQYSYISWKWTLLAFVVNVSGPVLVALGLWYFAFLFAGIEGYANSYIMLKAFSRDIPRGRGQKICV